MQYRNGSIIVYRTFSGATKRVEVEYKSEDIKDGRPGFDSTCGSWGYDDQIVRLEKF